MSHTDTAASGERPSVAQNPDAVEPKHFQSYKQPSKPAHCAFLYEETRQDDPSTDHITLTVSTSWLSRIAASVKDCLSLSNVRL